MKKKIILVDDHPIVRQGFAQLINQEPDLEVIGEAATADKAFQIITELVPDLALVDITLKESNGIELIKNIIHYNPDIKILVVSLHDENVYAERCLRAGAKGYIMKAEATDNVMTAIRSVLKGAMYMSEKLRNYVVQRMFEKNVRKNPQDLETDALSDREFEVFQFIGEGINTSEIASMLRLSKKTVETYRSNIKNKLNIKNSTELLQKAVEWKMRTAK